MCCGIPTDSDQEENNVTMSAFCTIRKRRVGTEYTFVCVHVCVLPVAETGTSAQPSVKSLGEK